MIIGDGLLRGLSQLDAQIPVKADPQEEEEEEEKACLDFTSYTNSKRMYWQIRRRRPSSTSIYILHPPPPKPFDQVSLNTYIFRFDIWAQYLHYTEISNTKMYDLWWLNKYLAVASTQV